MHEERDVTEPVVAGFSEFGLAGLTTVDYLADQLAMDPVGHVQAGGLPSITPFHEGEPRHPTRLHADESVPITTLVGEQLVPVWAAEAFGASLLEWLERNGVDELCLVRGVPFAHGPTDQLETELPAVRKLRFATGCYSQRNKYVGVRRSVG